MTMLKINDDDLKQLESDLKTFAKRAYPFATKNTINSAAFEAQKRYRQNADSQMIHRNKFTKQSIRVDMARTLNVSRQAATVGSIAPYMIDQEFGTTITKNGDKGVPLATSYSAGQGEGSQPRTRLPRKPNSMKAIQLAKRRTRGKTKRQRNFILVREAAQSGRKYIFMDLGRKKGIFKVVGGKRRPRIKMIYDLSEKSVVIPANPMLKPAVDQVSKLMPELYRKSLVFQLKRNKLFKG